MNRSLALLAAFLLTTPVFAHDHDDEDDGWRGDDELSWETSPGGERDSSSQGERDSWSPQRSWDPGYEDPPPPPSWEAEPARGPSIDDFRRDRELSWAGEWIDTPEYGVVWRPRNVSSDWRPYMLGRWAWTDAGWTWVSDEPFGWAVYHYGRWASLAGFGWTWVPGRVWAPAWVAWRWGNGYAGWCPLGPRASVVFEPSRWVFVPERHFLAPVPHHVAPIYEARRFAPRMQVFPLMMGRRAGPPVSFVERNIGRPLRPAPIVEVRQPRAIVPGAPQVQVYRPRTLPMTRPWGDARAQPAARPNSPGYRGSPPGRGGESQAQQDARGGPHARPGHR